MRIIVLITSVLTSLTLFGCTGWRGAPWCAQYNTGQNDCSFYSFEQCEASLSGVGGTCVPNGFSKAQ